MQNSPPVLQEVPGPRLLRIYRATHDLTQTDFGRRVGSVTSQVSAWETGETTPSLRKAGQIELETQGAVPIASWLLPAQVRDHGVQNLANGNEPSAAAGERGVA